MNSIFKSLSITALLLFGVSAYAEDKIVITGEPIVLEQQEGVYHVPADYTATTTYHYVMVDGAKRVCYAEKQPNLAALDLVTLDVMVGGETVVWNCYMYDPAYFEIQTTVE
ncbi:hypothetical protein [Legionella londiniensis]|uniref:Secreted protein n=1 Tax=Legionella londiniensis TaxID=45068 RepID=A0A0W0VP54_9GAMM|nr:hypothetical protein [Legionella londiniensis]KTD21558.1 hypothetical protein Llon_0723 [Legionella londiniensis]STX92765.1 Uncharacterised protein [Legionella londiniensis]